jgi:U4/U6 small nuclear ribonucleoprotein SNU13
MKVLYKGGAEAIILAANFDPIEIIMTLPLICEEKNVPYCFVSSKANLGRACGIKIPVVAICVTF